MRNHSWKQIGQKWYLWGLGLLAVLSLFCVLLGVILSLQNQIELAQAAPQYLLRDNAGRVALYAADGSGPLAQYDIFTRMLPQADVLALQQGIPVQDEAQLATLLEDYGQ